MIGSLTALVFVATSGVAEGQMRPPMPKGAGPAHRVQVGNPVVGKELFRQKGCVNCHAIKGEGGKVGPDLAKTPHTHNVYTMAAVMWNHSPHMREVMEQKGVRRPEFKGDDMAHLLAYLHSLDVVGDAANGRALFVSKGCVRCHAIEGEGGKIGPDLGRTAHPHPPFELVGVMWNHSPTMTAMMGALGIQRPLFEGNEMADLLAYLQQVQAREGAPARQGGGEHGH